VRAEDDLEATVDPASREPQEEPATEAVPDLDEEVELPSEVEVPRSEVESHSAGGGPTLEDRSAPSRPEVEASASVSPAQRLGIDAADARSGVESKVPSLGEEPRSTAPAARRSEGEASPRVEVGRVVVVEAEGDGRPDPEPAAPEPEPERAPRKRWSLFRRGGDR
jgi:hypothetical protein